MTAPTTYPTVPDIPVKHKIFRKEAMDLQGSLLLDFDKFIAQHWILLVEPLYDGGPSLIAELADPKAPPVTYPRLVRSAKFRALQAEFGLRLDAVFSSVDKELRKLIVSTGATGVSYAENLYKLYTSKTFQQAIRKDLEQVLLKQYGTALLPHLKDDIYAQTFAGFSREMITNVRKGLPAETITKYAVDRGASQGLNHVLLVARDQSLRAFREGDLQLFRTADEIDRFQRTASHDGAVCMLCLSLDGKIYEKNEIPELHPQDRCDFLPLLKGQAPYNWTNGQEWLKAQPESKQREILGPARFDLFQGGTALSSFVSVTDHSVWGPSLSATALDQIPGYFR